MAETQLVHHTDVIPVALLDALPDVLFVFDEQGTYLSVISSQHNLKNLQANNFIDRKINEVWQDPLASLFMNAVSQTFKTGKPQTLEYERQTLHGLGWFEGRTQLLVDSPYGHNVVLFLARDISERKQLEITRNKMESQLNSIYELGFIGFAFSIDGRKWGRVNRYLCELLEYPEAELLSLPWTEFTHPDDILSNMNDYKLMLNGQNDGYSLDKRYISKTGRVIPVHITVRCSRLPDGQIEYVTTMVEDISERVRQESEIRHLAFYDALTSLPNRSHFSDRLQQALKMRHEGVTRYAALMFIDLDHFKTLNDTLGHEKGDELLRLVASRLSDCIKEPDVVARQGGDEFVVLLADAGDDLQSARISSALLGEKILAVLGAPYFIDGLEHNSSASIGITMFAENPPSSDELMKHADIAMYQAKNLGRNMFCFFDHQMQEKVTLRAELSADLRIAIRDEQFRLFYQPQVNHSGLVVGAEALIRWEHPVRGMVSPAEFIPLAEETGVILSVGNWVLKTACQQLAEWARKPGYNMLTIAVNVSVRQFHQSDFVERVLSIIDETGADPTKLKLELTESMLLQDIEDIIEKMTLLKKRGIGFSLDDFGTGYSSLVYLKRLPLDQLKIDQSFVRDLLTDPNDNEIARTIVTLAESMKLDVIAEGVETEEQRDRLASHGCFTYQGYLFGKPVPIESFIFPS